MTSADTVRTRFDIDDVYAPVLDVLAVTEPMEPALPQGAAARERLRALGVGDGAADDIVAVLPALRADADAWWLLTRCYAQLVRRIDAPDFVRPRWPSLARSDDPLAPYVYVAVFVAAVPEIESWYRERGIDTAILWDTLADLGTRMRIRARVLGRHGRGLDTEQRWLTQHFTAQLFQLGRLQFNRDGWYYAPSLASLVPSSLRGARAVGVHIPEGGALDPGACDESFAAARDFFDRFFPDADFRVAVCASWLLDDQLADYLPSESNIVRFQRRFHVLPGDEPGNEDVFRFVFDQHNPIADDVQPRTRLQRAVVDHLRRGGEWHIRTGWVPL
jgi:GNAT-like C-terminal domain/N-acyltransferase N-terminal domain